LNLRVIPGAQQGYQAPDHVKAFNRRVLAAFASAPPNLTPHEAVRVLLENAAEVAMANGASMDDFGRASMAIYNAVSAHQNGKGG
jgi:hypothetical protein